MNGKLLTLLLFLRVLCLLIAITTILLLSFLSCPKLPEKLILNPFYKYLESNCALPSSHLAYRKKFGIYDAFYLWSKKILIKYKTYSSLSWSIIILLYTSSSKLVLPAAFSDVLTDFLCDSQQRILVNGAVSDLESIVSRASQGSVLGPLLFLIYTASVSCSLENKLVQYADNSAFICTVHSPEDRVAAFETSVKFSIGTNDERWNSVLIKLKDWE